MKTFKLLMMAGMMAFATAASAEGTIKCFTAEDVYFEGNTADLVVSIDYETTQTVCSWGFSLYLPDGVSIAGEFEGDTFYPDAATYDGTTNSRGIANKPVEITKKEDGGWLIVGYASGNPSMKSTHGTLVTIQLSGSKDIVGVGEIKSSSLAHSEAGQNISLDLGNLADYAFGINQETVGINEVKAADNDAPAYNLQGIRVNNAKGLIIRDGKKMIVK